MDKLAELNRQIQQVFYDSGLHNDETESYQMGFQDMKSAVLVCIGRIESLEILPKFGSNTCEDCNGSGTNRLTLCSTCSGTGKRE